MLRLLDTFSGIGGFSLAASWTGQIETIGFIEIEPFCQQVLRKNFSGIPIHGDITTFNGRTLRGSVDIVCGGFPCQDVSAAGKGEGISGKRSGLVFELLRIIGEIRPSYVLLENVPALRTRGADRVLLCMEEAGYAAEAFVVGADDIGAPHRRKRVWIAAFAMQQGLSPDTRPCGEDSQRQQDGRTTTTCSSDRETETAAFTSGSGRTGGTERQQPLGTEGGTRNKPRRSKIAPAGCWSEEWPEVAARLCRVDDGLSYWLDGRGRRRDSRSPRLRALGNTIVPHCAYIFFMAILQMHRERTGDE